MDRRELEERINTLAKELDAAQRELAELGDSGRESEEILFTDLFDMDEIQAIQDAFAEATGVASLITTPDGTPLTKPSNFCTLCNDIIRKTSIGRENCRKSDTFLGRVNTSGPVIQPCLSGGLWDGGASIIVNGQHIASWFVGQIRNEYLDEEKMRAYAREIGADEVVFMRALAKVKVMPLAQFKKVGEALFLLANLLSWTAYQNRQLLDNVREIRKSHDEVLVLRNYLSNIIDSMPSILVGVDPDGAITHWNMRAQDATGYSRKEVEGSLLSDVLPGMVDQMAKVSEAITERKPLLEENVPGVMGGVNGYQDISIYPLVVNGVAGAVVRVDDVTERVRMEEMMIQSEKMLSVGGLAAGVAHEVNNPLAAIIGNAKLIRKRLLEDSRRNRTVAEECGGTLETVVDYAQKRGLADMIEAIVESGERAGNVVTNMLSFSRKPDGEIREIDLTEVLDKTVDLVRSGQDLEGQYNFKNIEFVREYPEVPLLLPCEESKLQQVFFNILKNGAQAMTGEGQPAGREPKFVLRCTRSGESILVSLADNGPGMSAAVRRRVFEPFFTTKKQGVGTGLGLSVAYFIATEGLGGSLRVESAPGKGTTFLLELPYRGS